MSTREKTALSDVGEHILVRLLCKQHEGFTTREIAEALKTLVKERGSKAEQLRLVEAELNALSRAGYIARVRKAAHKLTPGGWRAALQALDWDEVPAALDWKALKKLLEARGKSRVIQAVVTALGLPLDASATLQQLTAALAWRALGVESDAEITLEALNQFLLARPAGTLAQLPVEQAVARVVPAASAPAATAAPRVAGAALPADDEAFAARVLTAARSSQTGRFGDDKVFISHVIRRLAEEGVAIGDATAFKTRLVSAHRRGLLSLNRADLVEAMDPADVDASETRYLSATFHFVRI